MATQTTQARKKKTDEERENNYLVSLEANISWKTCSSLITLDTHHQRELKQTTAMAKMPSSMIDGALYSKSLIPSSIQNWWQTVDHIHSNNNPKHCRHFPTLLLNWKTKLQGKKNMNVQALCFHASCKKSSTFLWLTATMKVVKCLDWAERKS